VPVLPSAAFGQLPTGLRDDLLGAFNEIVTNYEQRRWEPASLNGGKLCEAVYTIVRGYADGSYEARAKKPPNMVDACKAMEKEKHVPRSISIQIPRMLIALYEIRNNRGVGHAGGDVDPNEMDATAVLYMSKWLVAELVRVLHAIPTKEATELVETLVERKVALVWRAGDKKRVLRVGLTWKQNMLLLMASETGDVQEADMIRWLEHRTPARLRRDVLRPAHKERLIEYDEANGTIKLLPPGVEAAEELLRT
jgi:hypothetical protein